MIVGYITTENGKLHGVEAYKDSAINGDEALKCVARHNDQNVYLVCTGVQLIDTSIKTVEIVKHCLDKSSRYNTTFERELIKYTEDNQ